MFASLPAVTVSTPNPTVQLQYRIPHKLVSRVLCSSWDFESCNSCCIAVCDSWVSVLHVPTLWVRCWCGGQVICCIQVRRSQPWQWCCLTGAVAWIMDTDAWMCHVASVRKKMSLEHIVNHQDDSVSLLERCESVFIHLHFFKYILFFHES